MAPQTFAGETIEDVLAQVRATLGDDAIILSTEESTTGGVSGFFGKRTIVVTARPTGSERADQVLSAVDGVQVAVPAAPDDISDPVAFSQVLARQLDQVRMMEPVEPPVANPLDLPPSAPPASPLAAYRAADASSPGADNASLPSDPDEEARLRQREMARLAEEVIAQRAQRVALGAEPEEITLGPLPPPPAFVAEIAPDGDPFAAVPPAEGVIAEMAHAEADSKVPGAPDATDAAPSASLSATASRLDDALSSVRDGLALEQPAAVDALWNELRRAGIGEGNILAMRHGFAARSAAFPMDPGPRKSLREWISDGAPVVRSLGVAPAHTIAVVGQTGVGKSTSACKIAGRHHAAGQSIGLVAAGRGPHAVLEYYAREMGLSVMFAESADELARVHAELSERDLVVIDTAGRSHRHPDALAELAEMLGAVAVDEVHLVTTLATGPDDAALLADAFRPAGADRLIFTKLDESERVGNLINSPLSAGMPISYLADGVSVPESIAPATGRMVADLLLPSRRRA